jgi:hypothetical protein
MDVERWFRQNAEEPSHLEPERYAAQSLRGCLLGPSTAGNFDEHVATGGVGVGVGGGTMGGPPFKMKGRPVSLSGLEKNHGLQIIPIWSEFSSITIFIYFWVGGR